MKLSTRSRYGLRAMMALALSDTREPVMTREIGEMQNLPVTYLEQLMLALRKAGLVNAMRGSKGGYTLAHDPKDISLANIVEALEGKLDIADCSEVPNCCMIREECALRDVFESVNNTLYNAFNQTSLADIVAEQRNKSAAAVVMYYI